MASPSDHDLILEIQAGRRDALGTLFDRHSSALYEFIYRVTGDRDQSARLLIELFSRVPSVVAGMTEHDQVRGWLYNLARESALGFLRQKNWLDALPPSDEPSVSGLAGDIWRAARAMPAFHRADLVVEELHGLSPTEKSRALNVARTDLPRLLDEARRSFDSQFDIQARQQGRPPASQIDPERIWGMRRRVGSSGSLFGFLPSVVLPDSLGAMVRSQVLVGGPAPGATAVYVQLPPDEAEVEGPPPAAGILPGGCAIRVIVMALVVALVIVLAAILAGFLLTRDTTPPTISRIEPSDGATLAGDSPFVIRATYSDDRAMDVKTARLVVDGIDVTSKAVVSDTTLTYNGGSMDPGQHVVLVEIRDSSGNRSSRAWQFTVAPAQPTETPTPIFLPTEAPTPFPIATVVILSTPTATPTPTVQRPPVVTFSANQTVVNAGTPVLLAWNVQGADIVYLDQNKVDAIGTQNVTVNNTTTYHIIANNAAGTTDKAVTITVLTLPDLIVSDISLNTVGQLTYTIKNTGTGDVTQQFLIELFQDGFPILSNFAVSSLPAGQGATLFYPNTILGTHTYTVRANFTKIVQESNYNNNTLTVTIIGPTPTPTNTPTATPTQTFTPTPSLTFTPTPTATPTNTPVPQITNAVISLTSPSTYTGSCPALFSFSASITSNNAMSATYQWETIGGSAQGPFTISFLQAGTQAVTTNVNPGSTGAFVERVHILTPNDFPSNQVGFTNNCITPTP